MITRYCCSVGFNLRALFPVLFGCTSIKTPQSTEGGLQAGIRDGELLRAGETVRIAGELTAVGLCRRVPGLLCALLLAACAAQGPGYQEVMADADPVAANAVRVVILRPRDRDDGTNGGRAKIQVNDRAAADLSYGGFYFLDTTPGALTVRASGRYRVTGACEISIDAAPESTIYVDVGPRASYMIAAMVGSVAGVTAAPDVYGSVGGAVAGTTAGVAAASTADSAAASVVAGQGKPCGGPYKLQLLSEETALTRLEGLVWSQYQR